MLWLFRTVMAIVGIVFFTVPAIYYLVHGDLLIAAGQCGEAVLFAWGWVWLEERRCKQRRRTR